MWTSIRGRWAALIAGVIVWPIVWAQSPPPDKAAAPRPGYLIVIATGVDPQRMRDYARAATPIVIAHGGRLLFATREGENEILEGGPFASAIRVLEFPSVQAVRDFYHSAEYQKVIPLRLGNGKLDVMVADAFVLDATPVTSAK
ncbi:MAG: DUF1330 domain-containing protein [Steroidobacteraceae bacterium]|nr:DUF1330 domain-containing protein [Steroidobacteraceae bacterium]